MLRANSDAEPRLRFYLVYRFLVYAISGFYSNQCMNRTSELPPFVIIFILTWGRGSDLVSLSRQSMPVITNVGKNLRQVFPTFKNRSIGVSELSVSLVCRSIVTCIVSRCCRTACVTVEFGRRTEAQVLSCLAVFGVCNLWILFQPMHEPDIWHDSVGDYFKVSWGGESYLLF